MKDNHGESHSIHYLKKGTNGVARNCVIQICESDVRVTFSVIRSICARLHIDPAVFGLTLG
jgi:hypothetical protein